MTRQSPKSWSKAQLKRSELEDSFKAVFVNICGLVDVVTSVVVVAGTNNCGWITVEMFPETQSKQPSTHSAPATDHKNTAQGSPESSQHCPVGRLSSWHLWENCLYAGVILPG